MADARKYAPGTHHGLLLISSKDAELGTADGIHNCLVVERPGQDLICAAFMARTGQCARSIWLHATIAGQATPTAIAERGKDGHFGLPGMRERAARIDARLTVVTSPRAGTEVVVTVPGRAIFRRPTATARQRLAAVFKSRPVEK